MTDMPIPCCDVCGVAWDERQVTIVSTIGGETTTTCSFCAGLIASGLIRPETGEDGSIVYRQWHMQPMIPGELLPRVEGT